MELPPTDPNAPILIVESDELLAQRMANDLQGAGYEVAIARDAASGLAQASEMPHALAIVDRLLAGGESGLWLCNHLRSRHTQMPLLLIIARDSVEDRVECLEAGADDYILKPYQADAFLNLIHIYLRPGDTSAPQLRFADLVLDLNRRCAVRRGQTISLTMKEFELLRFLMENPREVLTREQILENVWGYDFMGESNVIEVYVRYLRLKLEDEGQKRLIQTVRGVGYVLREG
ncbi:MAG: response regulator transcription factor [Cyanophyceae cyanobacterium]